MAEIEKLVSDLREMLADDEPSKNILNKGEEMYSDKKLRFFLSMALRDINSEPPVTSYTFETFDDEELIIMGGMVFCFISEGVLQLRNQLDYNDAGLTLSMFNKTGGYQSWTTFMLQMYLKSKQDFKRGVISRQPGAGFHGTRSQFSTDWGY